MIDFVSAAPAYIIPFLVVLSVLVFVHELGHYLVARWNGVKVEVFSIGFGREIFGFDDKAGTRWKFSLIPLGGYVQMFGDADPASSSEDKAAFEKLTKKEKDQTFYYKKVWQRAAIVFAGPAINFIFAIVILMGMYWAHGQGVTPALIGGVVEGSVAEKAGIEIDDRILTVNGQKISRFQELQRLVSVNLGKIMALEIERGDQIVTLELAPEVVRQEDNFGFSHSTGRLGVVSLPKTELMEHNAWTAFVSANQETWSISVATLRAVGQMIIGTRSTEELGGVIRIGAYAKEFSEAGWISLLTFTAIISINLGLINLFPIPLLDGGHLFFFAWEAVFGKPMHAKARDIGIRIGYASLIGIMVYATLNDLIQLNVFEYLSGLLS